LYLGLESRQPPPRTAQIPLCRSRGNEAHFKTRRESTNEDEASSRRLLQDAKVFHAFAAPGQKLAELHVGYEQQPEFPLRRHENPQSPLNWRMERMKLIKPGRANVPASPYCCEDREKLGLAGTLALPAATATLVNNDFLTLDGIPPETFEYRLGNRSALEWVIDQYQVSTDKRSGITNDPNRPDDPEYIVRLLGQVITVSLETVKVVKELPALGR
jgi:predicted helicase